MPYQFDRPKKKTLYILHTPDTGNIPAAFYFNPLNGRKAMSA